MGRGGGGGGKGGGSKGGGGGAIDKAFDAAPGASDNFVSLAALRANLGGTRQSQDAIIHQAVTGGKFSLERHEGLVKPLTAAQKAAGIEQKGSLLVWIERM